jgi:hypothetical protein
MSNSTDLYLPRFLDFRDIYDLLRQAWHDEKRAGAAPTLPLIRKVWRKEPWFKNVKQPANAEFGHCETCVRLSQERRAGFSNDSEVAAFKARQALHTALHVVARRLMADFVAEAKQQPESVTFLTVDLTTSVYTPALSTTTRVSFSSAVVLVVAHCASGSFHCGNLASWCNLAHCDLSFVALCRSSRLQSICWKLGGLIDLGIGQRHLFLCAPTVAKDASLIMHVLYWQLVALKTSTTAAGRTADTLYLQVDGGSENVNK